jgi:hypothetical protein
MALIDDIPEPSDAEYREYLHWWELGPGVANHPVHRRVWSDGVDVTDRDPMTWPALWRTPEIYRRSRAGRSSRMGQG